MVHFCKYSTSLSPDLNIVLTPASHVFVNMLHLCVFRCIKLQFGGEETQNEAWSWLAANQLSTVVNTKESRFDFYSVRQGWNCINVLNITWTDEAHRGTLTWRKNQRASRWAVWWYSVFLKLNNVKNLFLCSLGERSCSSFLPEWTRKFLNSQKAADSLRRCGLFTGTWTASFKWADGCSRPDVSRKLRN